MKTLASRACFVMLLFIGCSLLEAQDVPDPEVVHPYQRITVPNLAVVTAMNAKSPAVAKAALAILLSGLHVKCDPGSQLESVADANAGAPLRTLVTRISGASCAMNGRMFRLTATFVPNGAIQGDSVIASVIEGKPLLFEWKGTLYVLYGVVYDEHLHNSGRRDNVIHELLLIDPRYSDKRRLVAFEREKNNFAEIEGVANISVSQQ